VKKRKYKQPGERYAQIPHSVLLSEAWRSLPHYAMAVLVAMAAQFDGKNNGDLALTWASARRFGIGSHEHLVKSLALLLDRGLIVKTRQGGRRPLGPCLYALAWRPINDRPGGYDDGIYATETASYAYMNWSAIGTAGGPVKKNHRDCRRTTSGLPAVPLAPVSGLPADNLGPFIGTAGSPPYRSTRSSARLRRKNGSGAVR
jgi:hypothetical protein